MVDLSGFGKLIAFDGVLLRDPEWERHHVHACIIMNVVLFAQQHAVHAHIIDKQVRIARDLPRSGNGVARLVIDEIER